MMRWTILILSLTCLMTLVGCSGPKQSEVDAALAVGDYHAAALMLRPYALKKTDDVELQEQWNHVRNQASQGHMAQLEALIQDGDLDAAELAVEQAIYFCPEKSEYRQRLMQLHEMRRGFSEQIRLVSTSIEREDWLAARRRLEPLLAYRVTFPELDRMWEQTARENYRIDMREGLRYLKISDYDRAQEYSLDALKLMPGDVPAEKQLRTTRDRAKAQELAMTARGLIEQQDYVNAVKNARQALALHSESSYIDSVLDESLRLAVEEVLAKEQEVYTQGDLRQSYLWLLEAQQLQPRQRKLCERIDNRYGIVTKEIAAHYLVHGLELEEAGYYGAALLYYSLAREIRPNFENLDVRLREAERKTAYRKVYRLLVMPTSEGERVAPGGGSLMAQTLITQLQERYPSLLKVYSFDEMFAEELRDTGLSPDGILSGTTEQLWLETPPPVQTTQTVRYVSGTVPGLNPEVERAKAAWQAAQQTLPEAQRSLATAEKEYQQAEAKLNSAQQAYDQIASTTAVNPQEAYQRQTRLNAANSQLTQARIVMATALMSKSLSQSALQKAQRDVESKLNYYLSRPPYIDVPKYRDYSYVISQFTTHGTARAQFHWKDLTGQMTLGPWTFESAFKFDDTVVAGYALAGIKEDPKDTPDDAEMLQYLTDKLTEKLIPQIEETVKTHGTLPLHRATRERSSGHDDPELHYLTLAWYARNTLTQSQQQEIQDRVKALIGYDIHSQHLDPTSMPMAPMK